MCCGWVGQGVEGEGCGGRWEVGAQVFCEVRLGGESVCDAVSLSQGEERMLLIPVPSEEPLSSHLARPLVATGVTCHERWV